MLHIGFPESPFDGAERLRPEACMSLRSIAQSLKFSCTGLTATSLTRLSSSVTFSCADWRIRSYSLTPLYCERPTTRTNSPAGCRVRLEVASGEERPGHLYTIVSKRLPGLGSSEPTPSRRVGVQSARMIRACRTAAVDECRGAFDPRSSGEFDRRICVEAR